MYFPKPLHIPALAKRIVFFSLGILLAVLNGFSQENDFVKSMQDPNKNFFEVQEEFKMYWNNRAYERGKGYKQFKRWEHFMQPRVAPDGTRFAPDAIYRAMQNQPEMFGLNTSQPGNWSYIGNTSVPTGGGGAGRVNAIVNEPGSTTTFYACAPGGGLWKTTNSGTSWAIMNTDFLASIGVSDVAIDPNNVNTIYIATGDGDAGDTYSIGVWKSTDGGNTWAATGLNWAVTQTFTISRLLIDPSNSNTLIAATNGGIYRSTNAGVSWTNVQSGSFKDLKFKPGDSNTVYACSNIFYKSTNNGASWTNITTGLPAASGISRLALAVSTNNPAYVYILAGGTNAANGYGFSGVYRSADSGTTFSTRATTPNLLGWNQNGGDTGGQAWYDLRIECDQTNAETVYTGGVNIWKSTNGGTTWANSSMWYTGTGSPYVHADIHALYCIPGSSTLLVGCDGGVFRTTNGGTAYSDLSANLQIAQMYCIGTSATNANRIITGWQDNGTCLKDGALHSRPLGGDGMECIIDPSNANTMYGEIYYGQIYKSTNGGVSFSTIVNSGGTAGTVNEDGAWVTPYVLGSNPQHLYVGKSRVYKSTNGGTSFVALGAVGSAAVVINELCVAPSDNNVIYCSKGSTLYKATDGNTFAALTGLPGQTISYICVDPTNASRVWVTLSGFSAGNKVYFSANGGTTWTNVSINLPNIPATCIVYQAGTNDGLYVGTDAGVYYKDATLSTWQPYMNNLPNVVIGELEIHYNSGTIAAATYGRGLWQAPLYITAVNDASLSSVNAPTAGNVCAAGVSPEVSVTNVGTNDLTSFTIQYGVVSQATFTYNWTGTLTTGQSITIPLNAYNYGTGSFTFNASLTLINGSATDENSTNNGQTVTYTVITAPVNDQCSTASTIVVDAAAITADNSATCTENTNPTCGGTVQMKDLWYKFVYTTGIISIQTSLGSLDDTRLALYSSCGGTQLACNDDAAGLGLASKITMACGTLTPGQTYYIQVGGYDGGSGTFGLSVTSSSSVVNDVCSTATPITTFGTAIACNNASTCSDGPALTCGSLAVMKDIWYSFTYTGGTVSIATSGGTLTDTQLSVYASCGGASVACDDDDGAGSYSLINFACTPGNGTAGAAEAYLLVPGTTYYIQVGGFGTATGTFNLTVTVTNVSGCTNPLACNYNPCANVNTGCVLGTTYYQDADGDTFGNPAVSQTACSAPVGYVTNNTDCNDSNNAVRPNTTEVCNTIDDDCDALIDEGVQTTFYRDQDGDGFGNLAVTTLACTAPVGYVSNSTDCNDNNNAIRPNATEVCNTIDDDCDALIDEGVQSTFYRDQDGDGFGNLAVTTLACTAPVGYVSNSTDCNDNNNAIRPNATEVCNGVDDDCDTLIDEGLLITYYQDNDGDGFGNTAITTTACSVPGGYSAASGDCNDNNNSIYPGAGEQCNSIDDDCDAAIDEGVVSQNWYADTDGDGFGAGAATVSCSQPVGFVLTNTDCAPTNAAINPGETEVCNGVDDDCDGSIDEGVQSTFYRDIDGDGFGNASVTTLACTAPVGYVANNTDCNDNNNAVRPNATEVCNTIDDDCDALIDEGVQSTFYRDQDGDGFGNLAVTTLACTAPVGYVSNSTDCNDNNNAIRPNATELCNGFDDDCDGLTDEGCTLGTIPNDEMATAITIPYNPMGSCSWTVGTLLGATPSNNVQASCITCNDAWYRFTPTQGGARIQCTTSSNNLVLALCDQTGNMIDSENLQSNTGNEILNFGQLTEGAPYYVRVINYNSAQGEGNFNLCVSALTDTRCNYGPGPYGLCSTFKAVYTGANGYTFRFTSNTTSNTYVGNTTNGLTPIQMSNIIGLPWGDTYTVAIDANYFITNGLNQNEWVSVLNNEPCNVIITSQPTTQMRPSDACPNVRYIGSTVKAEAWLCGAVYYEWEFTRTDVPQTPFTINGIDNSRFLTIPANAGFVPGATYVVRIRPILSSGPGIFGPAICFQLGVVGNPSFAIEGSNEFIPVQERNEWESNDMAHLEVYPNPLTSDILYLQFDQEVESPITYQMRDLTGRLVLKNQLNDTGSTLEIECPGLKAGIYYLTISSGTNTWQRAIVVE